MFRSLLLFGLLFALTVADDVVRVKLQPRRRPGRQSAIRRFFQDGDATNETLQDEGNMFYQGYIHVGDPIQTFVVDFDTGSPTTWLTVKGCEDDSKQPCKVFRTYYPNNSKTAKETDQHFSIHYGIGSATGKYINDNFGLTKDEENKTVKGFMFGGADELTDWSSPCDGLVGLSFGEGDEPANGLFIQSLLDNKVFNEPTFTVWMRSVPDSSSQVLGGEIIFGGSDDSRCGEVVTTTKAQVIPGPWWTFKVDSISLNNEVVQTGAVAITDTGTTQLLASNSVYAEIIKKYPILGQGGFDCNQTVTDLNLVFEINGRKLELTGDDLVIKSNGGCSSGLGNGEDEQWLLGDVFIRKYCQIHNYEAKTVGFAKALQESDLQ